MNILDNKKITWYNKETKGIDMSDIIDTIVDVSSAGVSVSECSIEVTYLDFDSLDTIEVPREAVEATEDAGPDSYDDYEENIFGDIDAGADPIEPADSLGRVWETYTVQINDKVLSLPCSIEEMRAAGLEMDTEYTPDNYVVNAGDYELAWFEDADGNSDPLCVQLLYEAVFQGSGSSVPGRGKGGLLRRRHRTSLFFHGHRRGASGRGGGSGCDSSGKSGGRGLRRRSQDQSGREEV